METLISVADSMAPETNDPAVAAIAYVLDHPNEDPLLFLKLWNEGEFEELRKCWEDVPDEVFIGAEYGFVKK